VPDWRSDEQLVAATLAGDRRAFGELVARHRGSVIAVADGRLRDHEAACDVTQDAFLKAYLNLSTLRSPARFRGWVCRIADREAVGAARKRGREVLTGCLRPESVSDAGQGLCDAIERAEVERRVRERLAELSKTTRRALILHHVSGYSQAEVAGELGLTTSAVKTRLSRARRRLRKGRARGRSAAGGRRW